MLVKAFAVILAIFGMAFSQLPADAPASVSQAQLRTSPPSCCCGAACCVTGRPANSLPASHQSALAFASAPGLCEPQRTLLLELQAPRTELPSARLHPLATESPPRVRFCTFLI